MKRFLIFLLLFSITFSNFGQSIIRFERTWNIEGSGDYSFNGAFVANNSNQFLLNYSTTPNMKLTNTDGNLRLQYSGNEKELSAIAFLLVDYDTSIKTDPVPSFIARKSTQLTSCTKEMSDAAINLSSNSSLNTIRNLTEFVYTYVEYDETLYGKIKPAPYVYDNPRGVCVEYSHLLISFARNLGYDTRYVSGYAHTTIWQPHAWVEIDIPGYGFLPIDPTFNQAGILDSTHIIVGKGKDQSDIFDSLETKAKLNFTSTDHVQLINQTTDPKGLNITYSFDENSGILDIILENKRNEYVFSNYGLSLAPEYSINENEIVLLKPNEKRTIQYEIDVSELDFGYRYNIPFITHLGDSRISETLIVEKSLPIPSEPMQDAPCTPFFLILLLLINLK
jgi:hypothetical protein